MKISLVCVGKIKEKYLTEGIAEFTKRLTPYCKLEDNPSPAEKEQVLAKETERLINAIPASAYVVLLDLQGREITSPQLAELFDGWALAGKSHIAFVIGGAFGYTDALRRRADMRWSFSELTFTHQMIRLLLVEQIYRAFKISRGEKYHW